MNPQYRVIQHTICERCHGRSIHYGMPCDTCGGKGYSENQIALTVALAMIGIETKSQSSGIWLDSEIEKPPHALDVLVVARDRDADDLDIYVGFWDSVGRRWYVKDSEDFDLEVKYWQHLPQMPAELYPVSI